MQTSKKCSRQSLICAGLRKKGWRREIIAGALREKIHQEKTLQEHLNEEKHPYHFLMFTTHKGYRKLTEKIRRMLEKGCRGRGKFKSNAQRGGSPKKSGDGVDE